MLKRKITTTGNSAALALSQDLLGLMGVSIGDEVELQLVDHTLLVRPIHEVEREGHVSRAMVDVVHRRSRLMRRLAEGATADKSRRK